VTEKVRVSAVAVKTSAVTPRALVAALFRAVSASASVASSS
jgi:hypothetical protein